MDKRIYISVVFLYALILNLDIYGTEILKNASLSVVKVETESSNASGFIWKQTDWVVTSLHVVDGKSKILVKYINDDGKIIKTSKAKVIKVLKKSDLVLLSLLAPLNRAALSLNVELPKAKQTLDALGFPLNISSASSTEIKVRFGGNKLKTILPAKALNNIKEYPSTDIEIINLEGNLVPGLSGGPILDKQGKVIGVVDGGLENGAIGICWGIPSNQILELENSVETKVPNAKGIKELFAADLKVDVEKTKKIGNLKLTKLKTRSFLELSLTADDKLSLGQLAELFSNFDPFSFRYDIYQEETSGATLVLPEGAKIYNEGDYHIASVGDTRMEVNFMIVPTNDLIDAQQKSIKFEKKFTEDYPNGQLFPDQAWSYFEPVTRYGVTVNRKGLYLNTMENYQWQTEKYLFETLATNGETLLAVAAVNHDNSPEMLQAEFLCTQYNNEECSKIIQSRKIFAQMALGVQLATFPQLQF